MSTQASPAPVASAASQRDPWLDNVKTILIILVVVGHSLTLLPLNDDVKATYKYLYLFHIPAFVLLTGYLSRSFRWTRPHFAKLWWSLVLPYLIFELAFAMFRQHIVGEPPLQRLWIDPHWPLWYLVAVVFWRPMVPVATRLGPWLATGGAVAISLASGLVSLHTLDLARVLGFLPFFVLGATLRPEQLRWLTTAPARIVGVVALALATQVPGWIEANHRIHAWYLRDSYAELGYSAPAGIALRLQILALALVLTVAVLSLVPRRRTRLTEIGAATLIVYLWHGFVILTAQALGYPEWSLNHQTLSLPLTVGAAALVAVALGSRTVSQRLRWLTDFDVARSFVSGRRRGERLGSA